MITTHQMQIQVVKTVHMRDREQYLKDNSHETKR